MLFTQPCLVFTQPCLGAPGIASIGNRIWVIGGCNDKGTLPSRRPNITPSSLDFSLLSLDFCAPDPLMFFVP